MQLTIFNDRGDRLYERGEENQRQYIRTISNLKALLGGFNVKVYDGDTYGKLRKNSDRWLFVCVKK